MKTPELNVRKVAIVIAAMSTPEADRVLDRFSPEQAQQVRQAMMDLGPIDPGEERRVLAEFFQAGARTPADYLPGVELDAGLARRLAAENARPGTNHSDAKPFFFLHDAEADKLAKALSNERAQTIALVLSHLPSEQAGMVLVRLESALQVEVIRRLVDLEETDPEILQEVEQALQAGLSQQINMQRRRTAGLKAVTGILQSSARQVGEKILDNLTTRDRALAEKLGPEPIDFDDLLLLDDASWGEIVTAAGAELTMLALIGAAPRLIERILRQLTAEEAEIIRHRLDHPGPTRLADVEEARRQIAELARRLVTAGRCQMPAVNHRRSLMSVA
jgi:flagellar motor switch protein FliG